ncbi:MAG: hypothetical protein ACQESC_03885 [Nanobdellota archaeon]
MTQKNDGMTVRDIRDKLDDISLNTTGLDIAVNEKWTSYLLKLEPRISMTSEKTQKAFYEVLGDKLSNEPERAAFFYEKAGFENGMQTVGDKMLKAGFPAYAARAYDRINDTVGMLMSAEAFRENGMLESARSAYKKVFEEFK